MWPTLKQKRGKFSIGRHASLYEIGISPGRFPFEVIPVVRRVHFGYWDSINVGSGEFIKMRALEEDGNVRKSSQVGGWRGGC